MKNKNTLKSSLIKSHPCRNIVLFFVAICILHVPLAKAQSNNNKEFKVRGTVRDGNSKEVLPGVNVTIKGTTKGTSTNTKGKYSLLVPSEKDTLVFSFLGYQTEQIPIEGRKKIDVKISAKVITGQEMVVTALGLTQKKEKIGYSTQEIDTKSIEDKTAPNIANLFNGKVAGLTINNPTGLFQSPQILLRGKEPLIVIDDVPVETNFFDISKNDIKEINVLKGTAASALYGSRGKDGAILITTKDASQEGLTVNISNSTMRTAGYTVFPKGQHQYGDGSNGKYAFWDGKGGGINDGDMIWGPKFEEGKKIPQWNSPILDTKTGEKIPWYGTVEGTKYDNKSRYKRVPIPWVSHNNLKAFMRTGILSNSNFSLGYKKGNAQYRFSGNYAYQQGRVPNTSVKRGGVSFASTFDITPSLTLDNKISYNKVFSPNFPAYGYGPNNHIYLLLVWQGTDVDPQALRNHLWVPGQEGYKQANWNYAWYNNPYFGAYKRNQESNTDVYRGQVKLKWDLTDNLFIQGRTSVNKRGKFKDQQRPKSYLRYGDPRDGFYKTWNTSDITFDNDIRVSYENKFSSDFNFSVTTGANSNYRSYEQYYNSTDGLVVPGVYSLSNTKRNPMASTYKKKKAIRSVYATMDLEFYDAFYLNLSGRNDWSSVMPKSTNSYFYPSASLSTIISNLIDLPAPISNLRAHASWAQVSSDLDPNFNDPYQTKAYYQKTGTYNGLPELTYPSDIINPYIKPQQSISKEVGLSAGFFDDRVNFDITYYNVLDKNQIINLPISMASGFTSRKVNGNEYTTKGLEISLNSTPVQSRDFNWHLNANWSRRVRRLTSIYGNQDTYNNLHVGERADNYYTTGWMKTQDGRLILDEKTGLPTRDPYPQLKGHKLPNWRFGLQNQFHYKKFSLSISIDGAVGGVMSSLTVRKLWWGGKHPESVRWRDQEYAAGKPVYVPKGVNVVSGELKTDADGNIISDTRTYKENTTAVSWQTWCQNYPYRAGVTQDESKLFANIFDRSFIKLRDVSLTYDITYLLKKFDVGLKKVSLTAFGYNLAILKKAKIIDPDFGNDNNLQDPSSRYLGLKIDASF